MAKQYQKYSDPETTADEASEVISLELPTFCCFTMILKELFTITKGVNQMVVEVICTVIITIFALVGIFTIVAQELAKSRMSEAPSVRIGVNAINKKDILLSGMLRFPLSIAKSPDGTIQMYMDSEIVETRTGETSRYVLPCNVVLVKITEEDLKKLGEEPEIGDRRGR